MHWAVLLAFDEFSGPMTVWQTTIFIVSSARYFCIVYQTWAFICRIFGVCASKNVWKSDERFLLSTPPIDFILISLISHNKRNKVRFCPLSSASTHTTSGLSITQYTSITICVISLPWRPHQLRCGSPTFFATLYVTHFCGLPALNFW